MIGRHGRPDPVKWPQDPVEIRQAYPDTGEMRVRFLGGGEIAVHRLGRHPSNWDVVEFGAEQPAEFLRTLDFFVYFHDPHLVEGFGRTILEAMAAGLPVIVGEHFRGTFGDAALYTDPAGVRDLVLKLHADRAQYRAVVRRARTFVERRFGTAVARVPARPAAVPAGAGAASRAQTAGRSGTGSCWSATSWTGCWRSPAGSRSTSSRCWSPARSGSRAPTCWSSTCRRSGSPPPAGPASCATGCATWSTCTPLARW